MLTGKRKTRSAGGSESAIEPPTSGPTTNFSSKEQAFLHSYFDANSPTKGKGKESAIAAGLSDHRLYAKILKKFENSVFAGALEAVGLSRMTLALRLKRIIDDPNADNKDILAASKLMLSVMGERTETGTAGVNVNIATQPKSLVFVGFEGEGISSMLRGKKPAQLTESVDAPQVTDAVLESGLDGEAREAGD